MANFDYMVVGAGFAGATLANSLASAGKSVLICDKLPHVAGSCYDHYNSYGILETKYGAHVFHTNSELVQNYLSKFTEWVPYQHKVSSYSTSPKYQDLVKDPRASNFLPFPINLQTLRIISGQEIPNAWQAELYLKTVVDSPPPGKQAGRAAENMEEYLLQTIGRTLYERFYRAYTLKQWGIPASQLSVSVGKRIKVRLSDDNRYFTDTFQAQPKKGFTNLVQNMLVSTPRLVTVELNTDKWINLYRQHKVKQLIYTGSIDEYYAYRFGPLPYRSVKVSNSTVSSLTCIQPTGIVNYPDMDVPYTKSVEYRQLMGENFQPSKPYTTIGYETPESYSHEDASSGIPLYPMPTKEADEVYGKYKAFARKDGQVIFTGRLGSYKYYNIDQVVAQSLALANRLKTGHNVL